MIPSSRYSLLGISIATSFTGGRSANNPMHAGHVTRDMLSQFFLLTPSLTRVGIQLYHKLQLNTSVWPLQQKSLGELGSDQRTPVWVYAICWWGSLKAGWRWSGSNDAIYSRAILTAGLVQWCENCGGNNLISESGHSCILSTLYTTAANGTSQNSTKFGEVRYGLLLVAKIITGF